VARKLLNFFWFSDLKGLVGAMEYGGDTIPSAAPTNGAARPSAKPPEQTGRKVILVIDDNLVFQKAMLMKLRSFGYDVMTAEDGSAALTAVGRLKPDLILLDMNFPADVANGGGLGWDGFLILRWLRQMREAGNVPVIAITGGDLNLYREHCREAGILDLLPKPLDHEALLTKIRAVLHQEGTETKPSPPPAPNFQSVRRILFVDDNSPWHQEAVGNLSRQGYEVVTTDTAEGALSEAARIRPDLMILDSKLEKETGLNVMVLLLAAHPSVPLLVYAGLGLDEKGKRQLMDLGVFQIMQKRSMQELLGAVRSASERPRPDLEVPAAKPETMLPETRARFDTVLIVEDDPEFSDQLRSYLESQSFYVTCVFNATEALRQIVSTNFDVILTNIILPGYSGEDFYHEVERIKPEVCRRFIFMTGHEADPRSDNFIRRSRAFMLWKPFPMSDLLAAVQTVRRKNRLAHLVAQSRPVTAA
jgi:DNA-binding response OmpR family regulator